MSTLIEWLADHPDILITVSLVSLLFLVGSIILLAISIVMIPDDFLVRRNAKPSSDEGKTFKRFFMVFLRNLIGSVLIVLGVLLLFLPGQGLITILFGVLLVDLPGKERARARLKTFFQRPKTMGRINALRRKFGKAPLQVNSES